MDDLAGVPTALIRRILELDGYAVVAQDADHWVLVKRSVEHVSSVVQPIILPKTEPCIPIDILTSVLRQARITRRRYVELSEIAKAAAAFRRKAASVH